MKEDPGTGGIRARFSAAAGTYDDHAQVQAEAARRVIDLLRLLPDPARVLEVGCGTGQLTRLLLERFPRARIDAIDLAPGMIAEAQRNIAASGRIRWIVEDARTFTSSVPYPVIVASCSLHWLDPLAESIRHLSGLLSAGGRMAAAVMLDGTLSELHALRRLVAPGKIPPGRMPSPESLRRCIEAAGLGVERLDVEEVAAVCPSPERLVEQLRQQGLTGGPISRASHPLNRGEIRRLLEEYRAAYGVPGGVRVTYRIGHVLAGKPA